MSEKPSHLLSRARELISNNDLANAMILCEKVIKIDPTNVNGLLLATKCWMDLDVKHEDIKNSLENILSLKPKNETAIKGLKKFYENHMERFLDDAVEFYRSLFASNELVDKDYETIRKSLIKYSSSKETEKFICDCLLFRITNNNDISSLKTLFQIAARDFIVDKNRYYFEQFIALIAKFNSDNISSDANDLDYLKTMETLFRAFVDRMEPEFFFTLLNENIYGYMLFAEILCDHYLFSDCHDALDRAFDILESSDVFKPEDFYRFLKSIQIKNFIQWHNLEELQNNWPKNSIDIIPRYLWCQAEAISFTSFRISELNWSNEKSNWCLYLADHERIISLAIMNEDPSNLVENHKVLLNSPLTSFEWYLWSKVLEKFSFIEEQFQALDRGSKSSRVYFKNHEVLAKIYSERNDYQGAVNQLWLALDLHFCPDMLNSLVDLHMDHQKYEDPIAIFEKLELKNCSESLLEKFVKCLIHLDRITDALSTAQRLAKQYPSNGKNWQLLGDLYLERGNLSSAHTTYSRSLDLSGVSSDIFARMGNVFSLQYQESLNETDFDMSLKYYDKSLELTKTPVAIEGLSSVLYLHAEVSLKQLMFPRAVKDVQKLLDLLIDNECMLNESDFQMNLLGKTVFLSINGFIDNLINFSRLHIFLSTPQSVYIDPYEITEKCFEKSITKNLKKSESYFNLALLNLQQLNNRCIENQRGSVLFPDLYNKSESNFKAALHLDSTLHDAWKYLGYLYFRHGIVVGANVLDIQHCLSTAINLTSTADCIKDPEAVFLLGLLYSNENWCSLAKEVFERLQLDYPVNPIGYVGTYLLGSKDHTVSEQSYISKAIKCYNYRDEEYSLNDCRHRLNDSIVGLFCENLGFLIDPKCDLELFENTENCILLISDLKEALDGACVKYKALKSCGARMSSEKLKQYKEYDVFLTNLNLLIGNYRWDEWLISRSDNDFEDDYSKKLKTLRNIQKCWVNNDRETCVAHIRSFAQHLKMTLGENESNSKAITVSLSQPTQTWDELLLMSIESYLMSSPAKLVGYLELMVSRLPYLLCNDKLSFSMKSSIITLGTLILTANNQGLVISFIESIGLNFPNLDSEMVSFSRLVGRLKTIECSPKVGYQYFHDHCLKQPHDMNRWLNLLEFGLEYMDDLKDVDISKVFFFTNRPWCFTTFDVQRYAKILQTYASVLTRSCLCIQKNMVYHAIGLFPNLCSEIIKILQLEQ